MSFEAPEESPRRPSHTMFKFKFSVMKKSFTYSLLSLLFLLFYSCSDEPNQLELNNLKGDVVKTKVTRYEATEKFGEIEAKDEVEGVIVATYNENGYYASLIEYSEDVDEMEKYVYTYEDGILTERKVYFRDELIFHEKGTVSDGKITERVTWMNDTETTSKLTYDGDKISKEEYVRDGKEGSKTYTHLDDYGSFDMVDEFDGEEILTEVRNNSCHRRLSFETPTFSHTCEYDENGDLVKDKILNFRDGKVTYTEDNEYVYTKYDDNDNWTERNVYKDDKLKYVEKREITYNEDSSILNFFSKLKKKLF